MATNGPRNLRLRLTPLPVTCLPPHPKLAKQSTVDLHSFISAYQQECQLLLYTLLPQHFHNKGSPRTAPPCTAPIQISQSDGTLSPHLWTRRESTHEDASKAGTAAWIEFKRGIFDNHFANMASYDPNVFHARQVASWDAELKTLDFRSFGEDIEEVGMEVYELAYRMPHGLDNRVFATLVMRARISRDTLVIAQRPVDLATVPGAFYSNGLHRTAGADAEQRAHVVVGRYASIERMTRTGDGTVKWEVAVCSDAKGWMPQGVQQRALPGAMVKACGDVMRWFEELRERRRRRLEREASGGKSQVQVSCAPKGVHDQPGIYI